MLAAARPLSEMLWQAELAARPIDTPERRADLERRLMAHAGLIADRAVQSEYRRFLRDRLFQLGRRGAARRGTRSARPHALGRASPRDGLPPPPPRLARAAQSRDLPRRLVHAIPPLIEEWIEEIAAIEVPEPELDSAAARDSRDRARTSGA